MVLFIDEVFALVSFFNIKAIIRAKLICDVESCELYSILKGNEKW